MVKVAMHEEILHTDDNDRIDPATIATMLTP